MSYAVLQQLLLSVCVVDKPVPVYVKKTVDLPLETVWKCAWWDQAEDGVGGKEISFLLFEWINFDQNTFL